MKAFPFQKIIDWHQQNSRENLPWRNYDFDKKTLWYRVWLSEIILQQTQVSRWAIYFEKIIKAFPTIDSLATTSYDDFFEYYKWLGYYSRARNMLKTAIIVSEDFGWIFPEDTADLLSLPWVWPYTAEAIRAFAYQKPTLSFDTNLLKIFSRYYYWNKFVKLSKNELRELQQQFVKICPLLTLTSPLSVSPKGREVTKIISWREINNALMDFAQEQDTNKPSLSLSQGERSNTIWWDYPLPGCKYYKTKWKLEPIKQKKKNIFPTKDATVIIVLHKDHKIYFSGDLDNYKPFILWKSEINSREFAKDYFKEKYNLDISVCPPHKKDFQNWKPYLVCYAQIQKGKSEFGEFRWVKKSEIEIIF